MFFLALTELNMVKLCGVSAALGSLLMIILSKYYKVLIFTYILQKRKLGKYFDYLFHV